MTRVSIQHDGPVPTDEALAARAQSGSLDAFATLFHRYEGRLLGYVARRVPKPDAEDIVQESFVRAWASIDRFDTERRFSTWMFTITTRQTISHIRRRRLHESEPEIVVGPCATARLERRESSEALWDAAREVLTDEQHAAIWLRYVENMTAREIGRVLGRTAVGVRVLLHRARERLAEEMTCTS